MPESVDVVAASESVIREIEAQLDGLLSRKRSDIEKALAARIRSEQEETRLKIESMEREFDQEKKSLHDYRTLVAEVEAERSGILDDIQDILKRALGLQSQIEALARKTVEEIQRVVSLQDKVEALRRKTAEQAGFLKKNLGEKYGISAPAAGEDDACVSGLNLDQELEKLRRIKALLADRALIESEVRPSGSDFGAESLPGLDLDNGWKVRIPEIRELTQSARPEDDSGAELPSEESPAIGSGFETGEPPAVESLELLRVTEPAGEAGEISYFQSGEKTVLDADRLSRALEAAAADAEKTALKLEESGSVKEQFFIKQELICAQESLRKLVLKAVKLCERGTPVFPEKTRDILNLEILKGLLDGLSVGNWANPGDLMVFAREARGLRTAWLEMSGPPEEYRRSILDALREP